MDAEWLAWQEVIKTAKRIGIDTGEGLSLKEFRGPAADFWAAVREWGEQLAKLRSKPQSV